MDFAKVSVEIRNQSGKGPARRSRSSGKLPAVLYGHKVEPISLVLDPVELTHALDKERKRNTVFTLDVKNAAKSEAVMAMIREVQIDPMSRRPVHVDFIRVSMDEEVKVSVPLVLTGIPVGVTNGGNLHLSHHNLPIAAKPDAIPTKIELDVTALDIGDALHAVDLKLPPGVRTTLAPKESVASVVAPHVEKVEVEDEACHEKVGRLLSTVALFAGAIRLNAAGGLKSTGMDHVSRALRAFPTASTALTVQL